ncbi:MAG TPA: methionine adenosyltransferase [Nitrospiraceae bacterium]|nr:MAG: S-adenosylmethionine synthetase [Nitrospirae bacterium GWB2_47_37]HAK87927.1 S-adenosylmethionine synthetase [Nitrospiraceae bacterium]HCZ12042.1 methionine adenosyltransferase [Nitrospiraceae bacterium]
MVIIETFKGKSITEHRVEIVERKGTGHPDYMCDSIMDAISVALSKEYLKEFGAILHHNIDKGLLAAGRVYKGFGGGRVVRPMELTIGDRATFAAGGKKIPVAEIAVGAAKKWIKENLRFVDPEKHLKCRVVLAPGSEELTDIFRRPGKVLSANDTSAAVGYYPLSPTENVVLDLEKYLNSKKIKDKYPETGEDIKVMGLRKGNALDLTVAMPFIAPYIKSEKEYFARKSVVHKEMDGFLKKIKGFKNIEVNFNTLDEEGRGLGGIYLSLLGTSAEDADSGQVGRGNRVNGLISLNRPLGTEAAAGKNPVSHVGKIYNVLAHKIAKEIYEKIDGIKEVYVLLLSRIGTPIDQPQMAGAQVLLERGRKINEIARKAEDIFEKEFSQINKFCMELSRGKYPIC